MGYGYLLPSTWQELCTRRNFVVRARSLSIGAVRHLQQMTATGMGVEMMAAVDEESCENLSQVSELLFKPAIAVCESNCCCFNQLLLIKPVVVV